MSAQKLILKTSKVPALYAQEGAADAIVHIKCFCPWSGWTWLITELDRTTNLAFGFAYNAQDPEGAELGYIDLGELAAVRGPAGLRIERDIHFDPKPLSVAKAQECPGLFRPEYL